MTLQKEMTIHEVWKFLVTGHSVPNVMKIFKHRCTGPRCTMYIVAWHTWACAWGKSMFHEWAPFLALIVSAELKRASAYHVDFLNLPHTRLIYCHE